MELSHPARDGRIIYTIIVTKFIIIGLGGFLGAIARYSVGYYVGQKWGRNFPLGTFIVNITGSLLIGLLMPLLMEKLMVNPLWRLFLVVGFLGAYTTFSAFEYETGSLIADGDWMTTLLYVLSSVIVGFAALKMGEAIARSL